MRRVPVGLLGMLGLVVALESLVASRADRLIPFENWAWGHASRAAGSEAASCEVLMFGDSQVMMGVVPRLLTPESGTTSSAYNLAVPGGQAASSYFLFKRALESGARPSVVVVDFMPSLLDCELSRNAPRWPEVLGPRDALDLAWNAGDPSLFGSIMAARMLPSLRVRPALRDWIGRSGGSRRERHQRRVREQAKRRNIHVNEGALVAAESDGAGTRENALDWYAHGYPRPWYCRPLQELYVRRFFALAESRGIRVCWLLPPMHPDAKSLEDTRGDHSRYARFVSDMTNDYPSVVVLDARGAGYEAGAFLDMVHLSRTGAVALTSEIGFALRNPGKTPGRVLLGRRRRWDGGPVEDTEVSRAAIRNPSGDPSLMR